MSDPAFDTLGAARRLKAAGIEAEQAEAIVEVMGESVNQLVTVERFEAGLAMLQAQIDAVQSGLQARIDAVQSGLQARIDAVQSGLQARIDAVQTQLQAQIDGLSSRIDTLRIEMRADIVRSHLILVSILIAANALMMTILGVVLTHGAAP